MAYNEKFTDEELVAAVAEVVKQGGTKADLVARLGLEPEKGKQKVTNAMSRLRKAGVNLPKFTRPKGSGGKSGLTPEQVSAYNEQLEEANAV